MGASELYLYGDSSGGTQTVQTMLWMEHHRRQGMQFGFNITAADGTKINSGVLHTIHAVK